MPVSNQRMCLASTLANTAHRTRAAVRSARQIHADTDTVLMQNVAALSPSRM